MLPVMRAEVQAFAKGQVGKGVSAQASHRIVRETLTS